MKTKSTTEKIKEEIAVKGRNQVIFNQMEKFGFWPKDAPNPNEQQPGETDEEYEKRMKLSQDLDNCYQKIEEVTSKRSEILSRIAISNLIIAEDNISDEDLKSKIVKEYFKESKERRKLLREERAKKKQLRAEQWKLKKQTEIVCIGKGYSKNLNYKETNIEQLEKKGLPILQNESDLANLCGVDVKTIRFLVYHRDVVKTDHYYRFSLKKKTGGLRHIAAPMKKLKHVQAAILRNILERIEIHETAHGFKKNKSVITNSQIHLQNKGVVVSLDLKDFFPSISWARIFGMFKSFGYSGYVSSLLAMLCTYCEREVIDIKGEKMLVATTPRILPQGSPASPYITNIICLTMDKRLDRLAKKHGFTYTRYADDISFTHKDSRPQDFGKFMFAVEKIIKEEGFELNNEKTRICRNHHRQEITGIVINNKEISVPREWVMNFRAALHNAECEMNKPNGCLSYEKIMELQGMTSWLQSINPQRYGKYISKASNLISKGKSALQKI